MNGLGPRYDVWRTAAPEDDDPNDAPTTTVVVEPDDVLMELVSAAREAAQAHNALRSIVSAGIGAAMVRNERAHEALDAALAPYDNVSTIQEETDGNA